MIEQGRSPGVGTVAIVTCVGTGNMVRLLAGCPAAVVATETGARRNATVIKDGRDPAEGGMACLAIITAADMER